MKPAVDRAHSWVIAEVLRRGLIDAATILEPEGIELMAMKGIYLVHVLGMDASVRGMLDADAIVVRGSFPRAVKLLTATGEWVAADAWSSRTLTRTTAQGGVLDLHRIPLPPFFGRMRFSSLRRRAQRHPAFEGHVLVPDPDDAACFAIAHYVKDQLGAQGHGGVARDLEWLCEHTGVGPASVAARLREHHFRRAGLVAFRALAYADERWEPWFEALAPTPFERIASGATVTAVRRAARSDVRLGYLLVRSIGDDPLISAAGFAATAARFLRDQARQLMRP